MSSGLENISNTFNSLSTLYQMKYGKKPNADQLIDYARVAGGAELNLFDSFDRIYDNDREKGNSISHQRFFAEEYTILFETKEDGLICYNLTEGIAKEIDNGDLPGLLNIPPELDGVLKNTPWLKDVDLSVDKMNITKYSFDQTSEEIKVGNYNYQTKELKLDKPQGRQQFAEILGEYIKEGRSLTSFEDLFGFQSNALYANNPKTGNMEMLVTQEGKAFVIRYNPQDPANLNIEEYSNDEKIYTPKQREDGFTTANYRIVDNKLVYDLIDADGTIGMNGTNGNTGSISWGDPHFAINLNGEKLQCFDIQGRNNTVYNLIDSNEFILNSTFSDAIDANARVITDQNLTLKDSDINIVTHANGNFEILKNGQQIGNQTNYDQLNLTDKGIGLEYSLTNLKITYKNREITQDFNKNHINNNFNPKYGDKGILTQLIGAHDNDEDKDGNTVINGNNFNYDSFNQLLVDSKAANISAPVLFFDNDNSELMAEGFVNSISDSNKAEYIDEIFYGAFEGAEEITDSNDSRLTVLSTDSKTVADAKKAMKSALEFSTLQNEKTKEKTVNLIENWINSASEEIISDLTDNKNTNYVEKHEKYSGYSNSQWNEFMANTFITNDNFLAVTNNNDKKRKALLDINTDDLYKNLIADWNA